MARTLSGILQKRTHERCMSICFIDGVHAQEYLSYHALHREACQVLYNLQQRGLKPGDELVIQVNDNRSFIVIFWACLLGKIIAVPLSPGVQDKQKSKILRVWTKLNHAYLACDQLDFAKLDKLSTEDTNQQETISKIQSTVILTKDLLIDNGIGQICDASPDDIAYIQFSSGSTGNPKGVVLTHENLLYNINDIIACSETTEHDSILSWLPLTHDMGLICFHLVGVVRNIDQYILPTALFIRRPLIWLEKASEFKVTQLYSPNFGYQYLLAALKQSPDQPWDLSNVRLIYNGAEFISLHVTNQFLETMHRFGLRAVSMFPGYGLAEACVAVALSGVKDGMVTKTLNREFLNVADEVQGLPELADTRGINFIELGKPVTHCEIRICDDNDRLLPGGRVGHIQIRGKNVTAGYYNDTEATRSAFTEDGWLKTGDLGVLQDGNLTMVGRAKNIIVINGQNFYPHDIEYAILNSTDIELGKVVVCGARDHNSFQEELLVFVLYKGAPASFIPKVLSIKESVYNAMGLVVDKVIAVNKIPKTTSGKIQYFELVNQYSNHGFDAQLALTNEFLAKKNITDLSDEKLETLLCNTVKDSLGIDTISPGDNFLALGLTSLQSTKVILMIEHALGITLSLRVILNNPSVKELCDYLKTQTLTSASVHGIKALPLAEYYEVTPAQERFWMFHHFNANIRHALSLSSAITIEGKLNVSALRKAFESLVHKYEILRTGFLLVGNRVKQKIQEAETTAYTFEYVDVRKQDRRDIETLAREESVKGFFFDQGCLLRTKLFQLEEGQFLFYFSIHHIIADGWSVVLMTREISTLYNAYAAHERNPLPSLAVQFKDCAAWYLQLLKLPALEAHRKYWQSELADLTVLDLPVSHERSEIRTFKGKSLKFEFSEEVTFSLNKRCQEKGCTLFTMLMSVVYVLLHKYTNQEDIVVGTDLAGRNKKEIEDQIGYFLNTLPLRVPVNPNTDFDQVLYQVREKILNAFEHQLYSFDLMVDELDLLVVPGHQPLFDVLVILQNFDRSFEFLQDVEELKVTSLYIEESTSIVDLHWEFREANGELALYLRYNADLFQEDYIQRLVTHFNNLLLEVIKDPGKQIGEYDILSPEEKHQLLYHFNQATESCIDDFSFVAAFEECAGNTPDSVAVVFEDRVLTYRELNQQSNHLAHILRLKYGISANERVGLKIGRSDQMIVALVAILKSGGVYVAIDPEYPASRINYMLFDSNAKILLTDVYDDRIEAEVVLNIKELPDYSIQAPSTNPSHSNAPDALAYILYTSGSTGSPKGVIISRASLNDYIRTFKAYFSITETDKVIQQSSISFDTLVEEVYPVLCASGKVIVLKEGNRNIDEVVFSLALERATILSTTPYVLSEINKSASIPVDIRAIISGGDQLKSIDVDRLVKQVDIYDTYGPTEITVCATFSKIDSADTVSNIGKPLPNHQLYILDHVRNPVPVGIEGEIFISGAGLAIGYLNDPEGTAKHFFDSPFIAGERLYRTGDVGKWQPDGSIEFVGRQDHQVKIHGARIELGEVENCLRSHPGISNAVVVAKEDSNNEKRLVAYVVFVEKVSTADLRKYLGSVLPVNMIPASFISLPAVPLTNSGKVDRKALLVFGNEDVVELSEFEPATNALEESLIFIWQEVLGKDRIGIDDNFFALGGHSLKAARILSRLSKQLSVSLQLGDLLLNPTVRELGALIAKANRVQQEVIHSIAHQEVYELSYSQRRLWILSQLDDQGVSYNLSWRYDFEGKLTREAIEHAIPLIVQRHESLRTVIVISDGQPKQKILDSHSLIDIISFADVRLYQSEEYVSRTAVEEARMPFDLLKGPLIRIKILQIGADKYTMLLTMHHIVADGWSMEVFLQELSRLITRYKNGINSYTLPSLRIQYKDYAAWHNEKLKDVSIEKHREYWLNQFAGIIPVLELPTYRPRSASKTSQGRSLHASLSKDVSQKLNTLCQTYDATLFMVLTALVKIIFFRYTRQQDIIIGTPVANRDHEDLENQIGYYLNTLALRTELTEDDDFKTLLSNVKKTISGALEHQLYPIDKLIDELQLARDLNRSPLFDVLLVFQNFEDKQIRAAQIQSAIDINAIKEIDNGTSLNDWLIEFNEYGDRLNIKVRYNVDLFSEAQIERFVDHFRNLVQAVYKSQDSKIARYNFLSPNEELLVLTEKRESFQQHAKTIHALFEERVGENPDNIAVISEDLFVTYKEINARANQVAHYLREKRGVYAEEPVALVVDRTARMVIGVLGVLKSGAAYVPIDANYPVNRIKQILKESGARTLLFDNKDAINGLEIEVTCVELSDITTSPSVYPVTNPVNVTAGSHLAYILYTSGSSGAPKGVMVEHQNVWSVTESWRQAYHLDTIEVRLLQLANISFDVFTGDLCRALLHGGLLVIAPSKFSLRADSLYHLIRDHNINILESTPALLIPFMRYLRESELQLPSLKTFILGSDVCLMEDYIDLTAAYAGSMRLINSYGTTETTIDSSFYESTTFDFGGTIHTPIGRSLWNTDLFVLDNNRQLVPVGVEGEIYIGGLGIARGYLNQPELTNEKFLDHPFANGKKLYKTGDRGCWREDGNLEYRGRIDEQVKIRGYRIEIAEIEYALEQLLGINKAVVTVWNDSQGDKHLAGYLQSGGIIDPASIRVQLLINLPEHMVPAYFTQVDSFPLTSNGKLDRNSLPVPAFQTTSAYVAARNEVEQQLIGIWQTVLRRQPVGVTDNFFTLGGHSLKAMQVIMQVHKQLNVSLELKSIFTHPTIASLAELLSSAGRLTYSPIGPVDVQESYSLSHAQRRLWIEHQLNPDSTAYTIAGAHRLKGTIEVEALRSAFNALMERHESLRTIFVNVGGEPRQVIQDPGASGFILAFEDLHGVDDVESVLKVNVQRHSEVIFDLGKGPLAKAGLWRVAENEYVFALALHHIISDGWSMQVLLRDVLELYKGICESRRVTLPALPVQYKDYTHWQTQQLASDLTGIHQRYWIDQFSDQIPVLALATDRARPAVKSYRGDSVSLTLGHSITSALRQLSKDHGLTLFMTLVAGVKALLYRYTSLEDIVIGTPAAGRDHADLEDQIGFYVNMLPLRTRFSGQESFEKLLERVKQTNLGAFAHQSYPFDRLVEELPYEWDRSRSPLFDVVIALQNPPGSDDAKDMPKGMDISPYPKTTVSSIVDLRLEFTELPDDIYFILDYNTDLFKRQTAQQFQQYFVQLMSAVLEHGTCSISALPYLSQHQEQDLLRQGFKEEVSYPLSWTIVSVFEERVSAFKDSIAVVYEDRSLTYGELNARANQLAHCLHDEYGIESGELVGLLCERSEDLLIGILGILKAGGAYLPLDPGYPAERLRYMLEDSGVRVVVSDGSLHPDGQYSVVELGSAAVGKQRTENCGVAVRSDDLAYVIYTSGSTGQPKGVMIGHRQVVRLLFNDNFLFDFSHRDVWTLFHSVSFDFSVWEIFGSLLYGGKLVVISKSTARDASAYLNILSEHSVTVVNQVPSAFDQLLWVLEEGQLSPVLHVRYVIFGGEALHPSHLAPWRARYPGSVLVNMYGITETTVHVSYKEIGEEEIRSGVSNIGEVLPTLSLYLLDEHGQVVPMGVEGELYVGGAGLAQGYLNRPELTMERFVPNPFEGGPRLYRSGDRGRRLWDGTIEYLGRQDDQVKIRGYRIETGEIERALERIAGVEKGVVGVWTDGGGDKQLIGYIQGSEELDVDQVRASLGGQLPEHMIPSQVIRVKTFGLTSNGKLDKKSLPSPQALPGRDYVGARTEVERHLVEIWQTVLSRQPISVTDNFFALGGHSLKAMQVIMHVHKQMNISVDLRNIFIHPTISSLAAVLSTADRTVYQPIEPVEAQQSYGLSHAQKRLWIEQQLNPNSTAYNIAGAHWLKGKIKVEALRLAFTSLIDRHESLRTTFVSIGGEPRQIIHPPGSQGFMFIEEDIRAIDNAGVVLKAAVRQQSETVFDLSKGPLLKAGLWRVSEEEYVFVLTMHHIISDGWSMQILLREIMELYENYSAGRMTALPALRIQYKDYTHWQAQQVASAHIEIHQRYWQEQFSDQVPVLALATDYARPAVKSYRGDSVLLRLDQSVTSALRQLSKDHEVTLFMTIVAGVKTLLYRYTGQEDIVIGTPAAGRDHGDLENQIGFYVNMLPLRTRFSAQESFEKLLEQVKQMTLGAFAHQSYPFDRMVEELPYEWDRSRSPLFDVMVVVENDNLVRNISAKNSIHLREYPLELATSKVDLMVNISEGESEITGRIQFNSDIFSKEKITLIRERLCKYLETVAANPGLSLKENLSLADTELSGYKKSLDVSLEMNF